MSRKILIVAAVFTIAAIIMTVAACGGSTTTSSSGTSNSAVSSQQQAQPGTQQGGNVQQGQQGQANQGGQRGPGIDNTKLLARAAAILNVSVDKLTTAFNNAMPRRTDGGGTPPIGTPPTGTPPTGSGTPPAGTPPAGGQQGQPGQLALPDDVIQKIASELGLSADTVASAFKQAMSEQQPSTPAK
jgi:hypothetical protein